MSIKSSKHRRLLSHASNAPIAEKYSLLIADLAKVKPVSIEELRCAETLSLPFHVKEKK